MEQNTNFPRYEDGQYNTHTTRSFERKDENDSYKFKRNRRYNLRYNYL